MVFLAVDGISPLAGLTTHHEIEAHTNRALIDRASQVTVVADSSKIGKVAFARICELSDVDELITDDGADAGRDRRASGSRRPRHDRQGASLQRAACRRRERARMPGRQQLAVCLDQLVDHRASIWSIVSVAPALGSSITAW